MRPARRELYKKATPTIFQFRFYFDRLGSARYGSSMRARSRESVARRRKRRRRGEAKGEGNTGQRYAPRPLKTYPPAKKAIRVILS